MKNFLIRKCDGSVVDAVLSYWGTFEVMDCFMNVIHGYNKRWPREYFSMFIPVNLFKLANN